MEHILSKYDNDDEKDQQIEELAQANHELLSINEDLKKEAIQRSMHARDSTNSKLFNSGDQAQIEQNNALHTEMVIELNDQID